MQYKMLNEVLEVAAAFQPFTPSGKTTVEHLLEILNEGNKHNELTPKQKRVLNCLQTIVRAHTQKNTITFNGVIKRIANGSSL